MQSKTLALSSLRVMKLSTSNPLKAPFKTRNLTGRTSGTIVEGAKSLSMLQCHPESYYGVIEMVLRRNYVLDLRRRKKWGQRKNTQNV